MVVPSLMATCFYEPQLGLLSRRQGSSGMDCYCYDMHGSKLFSALMTEIYHVRRYRPLSALSTSFGHEIRLYEYFGVRLMLLLLHILHSLWQSSYA